MDSLQNGIAAFKAGKREDARKFFIAATKEEPNNLNVWGWMYNVCNNDKERTHCLKQMLRIEPANAKAKQLLDELAAQDFPPLERATDNPIEYQKLSETAYTKAYTKHTQKQGTSVQAADPKQQRNTLVGIGSIILICVICICAFSMYDPTGGVKDYKTMAEILCQFYVENMLKSPSTADFPTSANVQDLGNNTFEIRSYVDAQNSFGATIRTNYYCKIQYVGTAQDDESQSKFWQLLDIKLFE